MKRHIIIAIAGLLGAFVPGTSQAQVTLTLPASDLYGFLPSTVQAVKGQTVTFVNLDPVASPAGAPHDVRSTAFRTDKNRPWCVNFPGSAKCPLLYTPLIGAGEVAEVQGVADLQIGTAYEFYCTVHAGTMRGTITVVA